MNYIYVFITIAFTTLSQIIIKWRVGFSAGLPEDFLEKIIFLIKFLTDPWIIAGLVSQLIAGFSWMAALSKFDLSYIYPFTSISFVLVLLLSALLFHEQATPGKWIGLFFILTGILISSRI